MPAVQQEARAPTNVMKLWEPSTARKQNSNAKRFIDLIQKRHDREVKDFNALYAWSVTEPEAFWKEVWEFCQIKSSSPYGAVLENKELMPGAKWFTGAKLNFSENLLRRNDSHPAIIFWGEDKIRSALSYNELTQAVAKFALWLKEGGLEPGDRVAGYLPNLPEAVIAMLATASLGGVWSSCSPDFGVSGVLDRFGQIEPKVFLCADGYFFKGEKLDCLSKAKEIVRNLKSIKRTVVVPYVNSNPDFKDILNATVWSDIQARGDAKLSFVQVPFNHPLYIMYSSGTTGKPKCIVHGVGGTLIEHLKELFLHTDLKSEDRIFYQTTCGWMMWNWVVSGLAGGATLVLYDGSPFACEGRILFNLAEKERVTIFGTNAKYIAAIEKAGVCPKESHDLSALHTMLSTGSPLAPESFDFVYSKVKSDLCLSSISGGTDIIGCFALGSPLLPVYRGELQTRSLGLKVEVWDEKGRPVVGKKGELVCAAPFPSMPICFWGDKEGERYKKAYFSRFPGVWHHGDYVELTSNGGLVFYGRSDAVLNPGGVRIGTAEIYSQVEKLAEVEESICVGQDFEGDVRVILFVKLKKGVTLNEELQDKIRKQIKANASPFHVPKKIIQVPDIPRTRSGKIVELAVREVIHGREIKNEEALLNPESLEYFKGLEELGR